MVENAYHGVYKIPKDYVEEKTFCSDGGEVLVSKPLELDVVDIKENPLEKLTKP